MIKAGYQWTRWIIIFLMILFASFLLSNETKAADLTVGSGCTYATISAAITAANPGDTLMLEGGRTFTENITIPKDLTLQGGYTGCASGSSARTTIAAAVSASAAEIRNSEVTLRNMEITGGDSRTGGGVDVDVDSGNESRATLDNVRVTGNTGTYGAGLYLGSSSEVTLTNGTSIDNNTATFRGGGARVWGRLIVDSSNVGITNNSALHGGGVSVPGGVLEMSGHVGNNQATAGEGRGGGIQVYDGGEIILTSSSNVYDNTAFNGAGILADNASVTLQEAVIEDNAADNNGGGAYLISSSLTVTGRDSRIKGNTATGNGGGVFIDGSSTSELHNLFIEGNTANYGGGVFIAENSTAELHNLFIEGNTANSGGGVFIGESSTADLSSTVILGNTAKFGGGLLANNDSTLNVYNSLIAHNNAEESWGDAIWLNPGAELTGAGNTLAYNDAGGSPTGLAIGMVPGTISLLSLHCSIIWGHADSINDSGHSVTYSNIQDGYAGEGNLSLDPMFVNPGEADFHLQAISPVIGRCPFFSGMETDFDNEPRPITIREDSPDTPYDMGADEFSFPRAGINGGVCAYGTLTQAIAAAQAGDTIQAAAGEYFEAIDIINKDLTIIGNYQTDCTTPGKGQTILDASYHSRSTVNIRNNEVTLRNLEVTGGNAIGGDSRTGGGVDVDVDLGSGNESRATLDNVRVTGNTANYGAGLYLGSSSEVTLTNGTSIDNNTATFRGGGARVWGRLIVDSSNVGITNNSAPYGGGVSAEGGVLEMSGHVGNNQATAGEGRGGGIHVYNGGEIILTSSSNVYRNSAFDGAGIYADNASVTLQVAAIEDNTAANNGGGIAALGASTLNISSATLRHNTAGTYGGAVYIGNATLNTAYSYLHDNSAQRGGAIFQTGADSNSQVSNSLIYGNYATGAGSGIRSEGGTFSLIHSTLANNINAYGYSQVDTSGHVTNSIAWDNHSGGFLIISGTMEDTCSIDQSGNAGINADPRFVDPGSANFRLLADSPAIDACTTGLSPDLDNLPRPIGSRYDMGAYEFYYEYNVQAVIDPHGGGTVSGTGFHMAGSTVTLNASANTGYVFVNWTQGNQIVSCDPEYSFKLTANRNLQANFSQAQSQYTITGSASPVNSGTVTGSGSYTHGASVTMTALPNQGFALTNWIETWPGVTGYCVVSNDEQYSFTATRKRDLTANIRPKTLPGVMMLLLDDE